MEVSFLQCCSAVRLWCPTAYLPFSIKIKKKVNNKKRSKGLIVKLEVDDDTNILMKRGNQKVSECNTTFLEFIKKNKMFPCFWFVEFKIFFLNLSFSEFLKSSRSVEAKKTNQVTNLCRHRQSTNHRNEVELSQTSVFTSCQLFMLYWWLSCLCFFFLPWQIS